MRLAVSRVVVKGEGGVGVLEEVDLTAMRPSCEPIPETDNKERGER